MVFVPGAGLLANYTVYKVSKKIGISERAARKLGTVASVATAVATFDLPSLIVEGTMETIVEGAMYVGGVLSDQADGFCLAENATYDGGIIDNSAEDKIADADGTAKNPPEGRITEAVVHAGGRINMRQEPLLRKTSQTPKAHQNSDTNHRADIPHVHM
ncbi:hypothetical protein KP509_12G084000 [Ceratopteris richardii]|uniref:Uncharacterized protein n=1 Tax=Ceratopteris richardii TaxID=49495 RepID=A0A8T2TKQ1_CERRI|nr:hypothetical protein KP509_12G084000 [Ceratopteris richardii]